MVDLGRASVFVLGRIGGLTRHQLRTHLGRAGAQLVPRPAKDVTVVAVAADTAGQLLSGSRMMDLLEDVPEAAVLVSETALQRSLGLKPPPAAEERRFDRGEICRLSGLDEDFLFWLELFDIIDPVDGLHGYRDLVCAREVARLLKSGGDLADVVAAAVELHALGLRLSEARLVVGRHGEIRRSIHGVVAGIGGQFDLELDAPPENLDDVIECAEEAEEEGDLETAERLYDLGLKLDRDDPLIAFNLGNVQDAQGRAAEARISWRRAIERAPMFPDAWFNLGVSCEDCGRKEEAAQHYWMALTIDNSFADAAYNLALLLHELGRFAEALPVWERFIAIEPGSEDTLVARSKAADCRFRVRGLLAAV